ncbi:MAG: ABC transporter substrate-binding protein [Deinococcota bacterium]|jgi:peptide/nickel transport system substrate-binding protein|nr:ABC transporter substrate-binding protein [Deinococcota bacterium]
MVWDTLFALDENLEVQPQMVDSYTVSDDGLTYTFTLREGLSWHDGEPVRAADCVASIRRWGARDGMGQKLMSFTGSLEAVDERTFTLTLSEPYGLVLESLGKISSNVPFMMPERLANTDPFEQIGEIIGSGPFRFVEAEWQPGHRVVYERFEGYVPRGEPASFAAGGKVVNVDRVEWHYMPDHATAVSALGLGEVDLYEQPPVDLLPLLEGNPDVVIDLIDPIGTQGVLRPNFLHPPFDHPKAREALLYLVDQEDYMRAIIGNPEYYLDFCPAFFMCGAPHEASVGGELLRGKDIERARQLMEEAGYNGELVLILDPTDTPLAHGGALVTAQNLREIGVNVRLEAMDWATMTSRRAVKSPPDEGGWSIFHSWWLGVDQLSPISNISISGGGEEGAWFGWPSDERIEELRDQWAQTTDPEERARITEELQARLYEFVPYVPFGQFFQPTAYRTNLQGVIESPVPFFWNISKE